MDRTGVKLRGILLVLLATITLATFWPVLRDDFIRYDDSQYITENPRVLNGLTWANIAWAFRSGYASNWHPLTWLSHMVDVQLFGLKPLGHHLMSLLLHIANALLLLLLLNRMTGAVWRGFFVAAFFALHPLHVESVAWVAERKDVLSTFFWLLSLLAYVRYVRQAKLEVQSNSVFDAVLKSFQGKAGHFYMLALVCFALGLMSKPMLVTTPFVLFLVDYWPLGRSGVGPATTRVRNAMILAAEKLPFLFLAALSSAITLVAQEKSQTLIAGLPLFFRVSNAIVSYVKYLGKMIWPARLAIFYPHPNIRFSSAPMDGLPTSEQWPGGQIAAAALLLVSISLLFLLRRRRQPWLAFGWFWFLGMLIPVIGFIQVGSQAIADRYTYMPLTGLFIALVWTAGALAEKGSRFSRGVVGIGVALLGLCAITTQIQISYWRDNYTVFSHAVAVTSPNPVAEFNLGARFLQRKQYGLAQAHFRRALIADPNYGEAYAGLGYLFETLGKPDLALKQFHTAVRLRPWDDLSRCHIAFILERLGQKEEAIAEYRQALRLNPDNALAHYYLGAALCDRDELEEGAKQCAEALQLKPNFTDALLCLADSATKQGKLAIAEEALRKLVRLHPSSAELRINLGGLAWRQSRPQEALEHYAAAIQLDPREPVAYFDSGTILTAQDKNSEAAARFSEAIKLQPDYLEARVALSRLLAKQGKFDEAVAALQEATNLFLTNAVFYLELGKALNRAGKTNPAAISLSNAFRLDPDLASKMKDTTGAPYLGPR